MIDFFCKSMAGSSFCDERKYAQRLGPNTVGSNIVGRFDRSLRVIEGFCSGIYPKSSVSYIFKLN